MAPTRSVVQRRSASRGGSEASSPGTGLDVSPIAIGAMTYGEPDRGHPVWSKGEEEARLLIRHALDAGVNFFDTANLYPNGSSEEILGRVLKDFANRDEVVIATKLRHPMR